MTAAGTEGKQTPFALDPDRKPVGQGGDHGRLFVLSAPSGAGKTTLCRAVLDRFTDMSYSVSYTTRKPRQGEREGVDYHFVDREAFQQGLTDNLWAEWAEVHGCFYGTSAVFLETEMAAGRDILLDIDVQGAMQILEKYPAAVTIFVMPPSMAALKERLETRGTDSEAEIAKRLFNAQGEIAQRDRYHHIIVNDQLPETVVELIGIIQHESVNL